MAHLPVDPESPPRHGALSTQRAVGASVTEVWQRLLRRPDRFVTLDSAMFADPAITSAEYVCRYGNSGRDR